MSRIVLSIVVMFGLVGCGGGGNAKPLPKTEAITGTVTLDGEPLSEAIVTFIPEGATKGIECVGQTDAEGKYKPKQLRGGEGVPVGTYKVIVNRPLRGGKPVAPGEAGGGAGGILTESLPAKFSNVQATKLTAKVEAGGGEFDFKLTSK